MTTPPTGPPGPPQPPPTQEPPQSPRPGGDRQLESSDRPLLAFVLSLVAGLWMLASGADMGWGYHRGTMSGQGRVGMWTWHHQMMHGYGGGMTWTWIGIVAGILVLIGAVGVWVNPAASRGWGVLILVCSAIALLAGAGGIIGRALGIVGGILAFNRRPAERRSG